MTERLLGTRHLSEQVSRLRALGRFPDVVLLWIGHNSVDWAAGGAAGDLPDDQLVTAMTDVFIESYRHQIGRLLDAARGAPHAVAIVVFGLIDFERFFIARAYAERLRAAGSRLYPRLEDDYRYFISMRPEHRQGMISLARTMNGALKHLVESLASDSVVPPHVLVQYSDAFYDTDISSAATLSEVDGWHPSLLGHALLAASAHDAIDEVFAWRQSTRVWGGATGFREGSPLDARERRWASPAG
jgi:lysophospholipase L1-like esterase